MSPSYTLLLALFCLAGFPVDRSVRADERTSFKIERNVAYSNDGIAKHKADLYRPERGNRVGVIMIHGGAWASGSKFTMAEHAMKLAKRGYLVMSINYRLAPKHKFPAQLDDCRQAVFWLRSNAKRYGIAPNCIAAYGYSAGAQLASLLGTTDVENHLLNSYPPKPPETLEATTSEKKTERRNSLDNDATNLNHHGSDTKSTTKGNSTRLAKSEKPNSTKRPAQISTRVQAVVAGGAPCEFRTIPKDSTFVAYWLGGTREANPDAYRMASPTAFATADDPPFFFFHGEFDGLVPLRSPRQLLTKLQAVGVAAQIHVIKNANHLTAIMDDQTIELAGDFLDRVFQVDKAYPPYPKTEAERAESTKVGN